MKGKGGLAVDARSQNTEPGLSLCVSTHVHSAPGRHAHVRRYACAAGHEQCELRGFPGQLPPSLLQSPGVHQAPKPTRAQGALEDVGVLLYFYVERSWPTVFLWVSLPGPGVSLSERALTRPT